MARKTETFKAVEKILSDNRTSPFKPSPRDSDNELILQYLFFVKGVEITPQLALAIRETSFESITRARRKLQEQGKYLPSPEVAKKRRLKGYEIQQVAPSESPEGLQRRIEENG